jgi:hypothetical protein
MSISKDGSEVEKWQQAVDKMFEAKKEEEEPKLDMSDESPEEEAAEDAKMKKGTKKASERRETTFVIP